LLETLCSRSKEPEERSWEIAAERAVELALSAKKDARPRPWAREVVWTRGEWECGGTYSKKPGS
jgi:hypothetical protein